MKYRLIWDNCTPTYERRPTTQEDIENDIHVKEFDSAEDLLELLLDLADYDENDLEYFDLPANATTEDKIKALLHTFDDPGDGSVNILYISADGKEIEGAWPYDCLEYLDLEHCSEEDVKEAVMSDYDFSDSDKDFDPDDYYDYDQAVDYIEDHGVTCDGSTSVGGYVCDLLDEEYDEGEDYDTYYKQETLDRIIKLGQNEQIAEDLDLSEDKILSYKIQYNKGKINEEDLINDGFTKEEVQMILDYNDDLDESLNEATTGAEKDYILLIGDGNGAATMFGGDTFYTFRTKARNVNEAINNCQDEIRAIDKFDYFDECLEDEPNLTYAEYFNDLDPSGGDIWMPAYIKDGKVHWCVSKKGFLNGNDQFDNEEDAKLFGLDLSIENDLDESLDETTTVFDEFLNDCLDTEYDNYEKTGSFSDVADDYRLFADLVEEKFPEADDELKETLWVDFTDTLADIKYELDNPLTEDILDNLVDSMEIRGAIKYKIDALDDNTFDQLQKDICNKYPEVSTLWIDMIDFKNPLEKSKATKLKDKILDYIKKEYLEKIPEINAIDIADDDHEDNYFTYSFYVYSLDEDGNEIDCIEIFDTLDKAITFAQTQSCPTHIVYAPNFDPDNYGMENEGEYEDFEVVWESENLDESLTEDLDTSELTADDKETIDKISADIQDIEKDIVELEDTEVLSDNVEEEKVEEKVDPVLAYDKKRNEAAVKKYKELAHVADDEILTEDMLDTWALNRVSCYENFDINLLKELLLNK